MAELAMIGFRPHTATKPPRAAAGGKCNGRRDDDDDRFCGSGLWVRAEQRRTQHVAQLFPTFFYFLYRFNQSSNISTVDSQHATMQHGDFRVETTIDLETSQP